MYHWNFPKSEEREWFSQAMDIIEAKLASNIVDPVSYWGDFKEWLWELEYGSMDGFPGS